MQLRVLVDPSLSERQVETLEFDVSNAGLPLGEAGRGGGAANDVLGGLFTVWSGQPAFLQLHRTAQPNGAQPGQEFARLICHSRRLACTPRAGQWSGLRGEWLGPPGGLFEHDGRGRAERQRCGKTAFVEALLAAGDAPMIVGRCTPDGSVRRIPESSLRRDPEVKIRVLQLLHR